MMNCFGLSTANPASQALIIMQRLGRLGPGLVALGLMACAASAWSQQFRFLGSDPFGVQSKVSPAPETAWQPVEPLPKVPAPEVAPQPLRTAPLTLAELTEYA